MLESTLPIRNFYWSRGGFQPPLDSDGRTRGVAGQYALAWARGAGRVVLRRDRLGINKLFFAVHEAGKVVAGNYLIDLVRNGVPIEAIYSVPAAHAVEIDLDRLHITSTCCEPIEPESGPVGPEVDGVAREIRAALEEWFARLAAQFGGRPIWVCLSGGLDSGLIAALAREYFRDVTAYTYAFTAPGAETSEDAAAAERLAEALRIPLRLVPATAADVRDALTDAICYAQDWRDFNVHCAVVNELLARAMQRDAAGLPAGAPLVLTGDLANEFLADYTPVTYRGVEYYRLPRLEPSRLRLALIQGLDAGDREIGVFNHHGLDVIQPYGFVVDQYLRLPGWFIAATRAKQRLGRAMAGNLLPSFVFERVKVRAQLGSATDAPGILGVFAADGCDGAWLREAFCRLFTVQDARFLSNFIRTGRYRSMPDVSMGRRSWIDGYLAA